MPSLPSFFPPDQKRNRFWLPSCNLRAIIRQSNLWYIAYPIKFHLKSVYGFCSLPKGGGIAPAEAPLMMHAVFLEGAMPGIISPEEWQVYYRWNFKARNQYHDYPPIILRGKNIPKQIHFFCSTAELWWSSVQKVGAYPRVLQSVFERRRLFPLFFLHSTKSSCWSF